MFKHRLSPSGLYLPNGFAPGGDVLTNVYKGFFPRPAAQEAAQPMPPSAPVTVETFAIPLPTVWPQTDPPETFDPGKLLYLMWLNVVAYTDIQMGGTPGPASMTAFLCVDGPSDTIVPIENVVDDAACAFSTLAGGFFGRSSVHVIPDEGTDEVDVLNYTSLAVFRPGTIPLWVQPATPWVAGQTRHIYVQVQANGNESGVLVLLNHRSNIVIAEFYGDVVETIGLSASTGYTGGTSI